MPSLGKTAVFDQPRSNRSRGAILTLDNALKRNPSQSTAIDSDQPPAIALPARGEFPVVSDGPVYAVPRATDLRIDGAVPAAKAQGSLQFRIRSGDRLVQVIGLYRWRSSKSHGRNSGDGQHGFHKASCQGDALR